MDKVAEFSSRRSPVAARVHLLEYLHFGQTAAIGQIERFLYLAVILAGDVLGPAESHRIQPDEHVDPPGQKTIRRNVAAHTGLSLGHHHLANPGELVHHRAAGEDHARGDLCITGQCDTVGTDDVILDDGIVSGMGGRHPHRVVSNDRDVAITGSPVDRDALAEQVIVADSEVGDRFGFVTVILRVSAQYRKRVYLVVGADFA